jgi:hypothetical protein
MDRSIYPGINYTTFTTTLDTSWYQPTDWLTADWNMFEKKRTTKSMTNSNSKKEKRKGRLALTQECGYQILLDHIQ